MVLIKKRFSIIAFLLCKFCVLFSLADMAFAGTYWVSSNGAATWANCQNASPLSGASACARSTANSNAAAGDTVYFRAGTYSVAGDAIAPNNSGTSHSNRIIFSAYASEVPTFVGASSSSQGVYLNAKSYIKVHGMTFNNFYHPLQLENAHFNEISYCTFSGHYSNASVDWVGSRIRSGSTYNHIHHSSLSKYGFFDPNDNSAVFGIGIEENGTDNTHYNLIENCQLYHGAHHVLDFHGYQNIVRNSYIHNERWSNYGGELWGNRIIYSVSNNNWPAIGRNLFEGNRVAYGGECADSERGGSGGTWNGEYHIVRRNMFYRNNLYGMFVATYGSGYPTRWMKIYNNTFWYNGWSTTAPAKGMNDTESHGILVEEGSVVVNNAIKNNIFWQNKNLCNATRPVVEEDCTVPDTQVMANNWLEAGDPKFTNISGTPNPMNETQFNFNLQSDSSAIDNGGYLTTITSATGSGNSFTVADAGYFFDGWTMAANIPTATISADVIQLQGQATTATITNINYSTNTITFTPSLSWTNGQGIALSYSGTAPDNGAYEYKSGGTPATPAAPQGLL